MAVTLTGIRGSVATRGEDVAARLKDVERNDANDILSALKSDLNGKTGVLRLLHTSKDAEMKFRNADGMKHFASSGRLERAGEALGALLERAGASKDVLAEFEKYRTQRGGKGLESQQVVRFIETLKAESGASLAEALGKIGIREPRAGDLLGEGAYGKVSEISYRGQKCVFKEIMESAESKLPVITLEGSSSGRSVDQMSYAEFMDAVDGYRYHDRRDFPAAVLNEIKAYLKYEQVGYNLKKVTTEEKAIYDKWSERAWESNAPAGEPPKIRLNRHGESAAAWMKGDITHVVKPSVYIVRETGPGGTTFHAVPGGKFFKTWSTEKLTTGQSKLEISGIVMERAKGKQLVADADYGKTENQFRLFDKISSSQMKSVASSGLDALKQLGSHGFVHGDIKPANMIHDSSSGEVKIIDFSGLQKVSKNDNRLAASTGTEAYLMPGGAYAGYARDLFAMGASIVETGLKARGRHGDAENLIGAINDCNKGQGQLQAAQARRDGRPESWETVMNGIAAGEAEDSAVAFGIECMKQAKAWDVDKFGRYDAATSPREHPLNVVSRHPAVA